MNSSITKFYVIAQLKLAEFNKDRSGVTAIEYALIAVAMATLLAYILGSQDSGFLGALKNTFDKVADAINQVTIASPAP